MSRIVNKVIAITGAASGLGKLLSEKLAQDSNHLILIDRDQLGLTRISDSLKALNSKIEITTIVSDLSKLQSIRETSTTLSKIEVDILVNNAGIVSGKEILDLTNQNIIDTFMVNSIAPQILTRSVLGNMINRNSGQIVNLCSVSSFVGVAKLSDYAASKAAIYNFNESLRLEMKKGKHDISTTAFCPFYINTGMFDGVKTRFSFLLPILEPTYVVNRLYKAIFSREKRVILPRLVYATFLVKILPVSIFDILLNFFGINSSMDEFKGKK
ncbi:SDR family NAD(P)-dependent oxidoreductase [Bacteriovoracaceae bacterium]|nr:SDR family NAD(P)-dependent oxidoreductase [Bacteriovoracaceae bacterium]